MRRHSAVSFPFHSELVEMLRRIVALEAAVGSIRHDDPPPVETESPSSLNRAGPEESDRIVLDVPEAGRLLGLSRNAAYEAAKRGQIPTIRIGGRILVPRAALARLLSVDGETTLCENSLVIEQFNAAMARRGLTPRNKQYLKTKQSEGSGRPILPRKGTNPALAPEDGGAL